MFRNWSPDRKVKALAVQALLDSNAKRIWVRKTHELVQLGPQSKIIDTVRDPRDAVLSYQRSMRHTAGPAPAQAARSLRLFLARPVGERQIVADQAQDSVLKLLVFLETTAKRGRHRFRIALLNATRHHALMTRDDQHAQAFGR